MEMNGLYIVIASACILILAYRYYGAFLAAKVLVLDQFRPTPAVVHNDGHDYVPTNKWVTFGHHFAAIAGAGPLVGPVIAAQFGYLPGLLWILIGSVVAGAVHDMVILFASVRYDGKSIADIAKEEISNLASIGAMLATLFLLIITLAGMAVVVANALHNSAWGFFSVSMTIPIAIFVGIIYAGFAPAKFRKQRYRCSTYLCRHYLRSSSSRFLLCKLVPLRLTDHRNHVGCIRFLRSRLACMVVAGTA